MLAHSPYTVPLFSVTQANKRGSIIIEGNKKNEAKRFDSVQTDHPV